MAQRQQAGHRGLYDLKCRVATLSVGDLVLVKQTAWKGRHKIQDRWEREEYQVVGQPTPGVPVYTVKSLAGGKTKVLHGNLSLLLQGRIRQEGETVEEGVTDSDEEEEGRAVRPKVARAPKRSPRVTTKPQGSLTPAEPSASTLTDHFPPESISGDEDSNGEEDVTYNTDSLTPTLQPVVPPLLIYCQQRPVIAYPICLIVLQKVNLVLLLPTWKILVRHLIVYS